MDIFLRIFLCMKFSGIQIRIWLVYNALVAKRFLPHENEIAKLSIMREQGVQSSRQFIAGCKVTGFVNFFVNDKTCLTLYVICKFSLLTKSLFKIFNVFLNKYYKHDLTYLDSMSIDSQSVNIHN